MYKKLALILVLIVAFILRFYQLGANPPSLYWDEVALGYNAYSISQTLKDEEGRFLPVDYFRSFGDFKPPVYIYLAVPAIKLFGLNEWTTRLPSAIAGLLSVFLTYLIIKKLFEDNNKSNPTNPFSQIDSQWLAILSAFLLAVSPWHTQISRVAYEANVALLLTLLGVYAFLKAISSTKFKIYWFILSSVAFVLTLYTFNSNRLFTPLLVCTLGLIFWKDLAIKSKGNLKSAVIASIIGVLLLSPLLPHLFSDQGKLRYKEVNIFTNPSIVELSNERNERLDNVWWAKILNNRRIMYTQKWLEGYFSNFSGQFLFISGDSNPRFSLQDVGQLYLFELPFLLIGLYLFASNVNKKQVLFILLWMALGPIPAAFARENPHALRSLNTLPTLQVITAMGFLYSLKFLNSKDIIKLQSLKVNVPTLLFFTVTLFVVTLNIFYYLHNYYAHYPKYAQNEWQYGYKQMVSYIGSVHRDYDQIIITKSYGRPYIEFLFYLRYPPEKFQKERDYRIDNNGFGFVEVDSFNKYQFRGINWKEEIARQQDTHKTLVVGNARELEVNKYTKKTIKKLDNTNMFIINELPKGKDALFEMGFSDQIVNVK
ncbi:MAG: glycosyltransferase family 39 protein [bacterium]|nr:glycosyltransferase family 39 protein [bacterium]